MGRPAKYDNPKTMQTKIDEYFQDCKIPRKSKYIDKRGNVQEVEMPVVPTVMGLALYLGFVSTQSLLDYANKDKDVDGSDDEQFSAIITRAKTRCAKELNQLALAGQVDARIAALNLSANHGMTMKSDFELTGKDGSSLVMSDEDRGAVKRLADLLAQQVLIGAKSGERPAIEHHKK